MLLASQDTTRIFLRKILSQPEFELETSRLSGSLLQFKACDNIYRNNQYILRENIIFRGICINNNKLN